MNEYRDEFKDKLDIDRLTEDLVKYVENSRPKITYLDISGVQDSNITNTKPLLQFVDYDNVVENICNVKDVNEGLEKIKQILEDSNFEQRYFRTYKVNGKWYIDYGSHKAKFVVTEGGK